MGKAEELAGLGFTTIWLPPFTQSVSAEVRPSAPGYRDGTWEHLTPCKLYAGLLPHGQLLLATPRRSLPRCAEACCCCCCCPAVLHHTAPSTSTTMHPLQGYMPGDLYNLNSKYGSEAQLIGCVRALQAHGIKVRALKGGGGVGGARGQNCPLALCPLFLQLHCACPLALELAADTRIPPFMEHLLPFPTQVLGDAVLNHRCAQHQDENGVWNKYGGRLAWDQRAIVGEQAGLAGLV